MSADKIKIFGASDCYGLTKDFSFTLRRIIVMRDEVDGDHLKEAVKMLEKRFSYLRVSLKKDFHEFYYVYNDRPWVVLNTERPVDLNCEAGNFHLLAFSYYENRIYVNAYHGQMDGGGLFRVVKALLYYYCCLKYGKKLAVPDVMLPDDVVEPQEYEDAYRKFYERVKAPDKNAPPPQKKVGNIMKLQKMGLVKPGERTSIRISASQSDLMKYCSSNDGSPVTAVALMLADSIYGLHADSDKEIVVGIPVNLRPAMGLTKSHCNTYSKVYIHYDEKIRSKDFELQGTLCRGIVMRYTDKDLLREQTRKYCAKLALLNRIPLTSLKQLAARMTAASMKKAETADVTYVGRFEYGEMEKYIKAFYGDVDAYGLGLQILINAVGDKFFLTIDQDWQDMVYIDALCNTLKKHGISYEIEYAGPNEVPSLKL